MALYKVDISGIDTAALPTLTPQQLQELLQQCAAGDEAARERLICGNLRLVLSVIRRFASRGVAADDLFQVGCMGLIKAIDHFDLTLGVRFSTYAVPMIIGEIRRHLRDNNPLRVSRSLRDQAYRALRARESFAEQNHRDPTLDELATLLQQPREELVWAMEALQEPVSIFEPMYSEGGDTLAILDSLRDERNQGDTWADSLALRDAMARLTPREQHILRQRFYRGRTQMEVAEEIGISQAQVSRLEKSALRRMRRHMEAE